MNIDSERGFRLLAEAIDRQTEAITTAMSANRPKSEDPDLQITLAAKQILDNDVDGKLTQRAFSMALDLGRSTIFSHPKSDINKRLKRMFELHQANGYSAKRGFVTSNGIEATE